MARTIGDVITDVRDILQDTRSPYRYSDDSLYSYLNRAFINVKDIRPDAYWGRYTSGTYPPSYDIPEYSAGDEAELWPLSSVFFTPIVMYVAGSAELKDDEFTRDARAAILLETFRRHLITPSR